MKVAVETNSERGGGATRLAPDQTARSWTPVSFHPARALSQKIGPSHPSLGAVGDVLRRADSKDMNSIKLTYPGRRIREKPR